MSETVAAPKLNLREAAAAAYLEWSAVQSDRRAKEFAEQVRRANKALHSRLGFGPANWERPGANGAGFVDLVCIIDGVNLGAEFDGNGINSEVILLCLALNSDSDLAWRIVYSLVDLGRYLAENDESLAGAQ